MDKHFSDKYFIKTVYYNAGVQICRYSMNYYANLFSQQDLLQYFTKILYEYNCILIKDFAGRCEKFIYDYIKDRYQSKSDIFAIYDDFYGNNKLCGIILTAYDISVISSSVGNCLGPFYYGTDRRNHNDLYYSKIAEEFFSLCGDYCQ